MGVTLKIWSEARQRFYAVEGSEARFWRHVEWSDGCWLWLGGTSGTGYGRFYDGERMVSAHRFSYELINGPIPEGRVIDHLCRTTLCVRQDHLEVVEQRENLLRGDTFQARNVAKTHCPRGHEYSGQNLYVNKRGSRTCRACSRESSKAHYWAMRRQEAS